MSAISINLPDVSSMMKIDSVELIRNDVECCKVWIKVTDFAPYACAARPQYRIVASVNTGFSH